MPIKKTGLVALIIVLLLLVAGDGQATSRRHRYAGQPRNEEELMNRLLNCLRTKDTMGYYNLFPPFDTLWQMVIHNPDPSPETQKELARLREHPTVLIDLDPFYNHTIIGRFVQTLRKGEDSGLQWKGIIMQRFELQHQGLSRGMEGLQKIAPERFMGYMFVRDILTSTTYCITVMEIQKVNGFYVGGQVLNVLEASTTDEFLARERAELNYLAHRPPPEDPEKKKKEGIAASDSSFVDSFGLAAANVTVVDSAKIKKDILLSPAIPDDEASRMRREVVDRKYYKGKFDDEIPVELYVRYMKDKQDKVTKYWDALYKFGDMSEYVKLDVSKSPEDKWLFEEPVASMELDLAGKQYTGSWTNGGNQTGYDVELQQKELSQKKIEELDKILENGLWGKTDQQNIKEDDEDTPKKKKRREKANKDSDNDNDEAKDKSTDTDDQKKNKKKKKDEDDE